MKGRELNDLEDQLYEINRLENDQYLSWSRNHAGRFAAGVASGAYLLSLFVVMPSLQAFYPGWRGFILGAIALGAGAIAWFAKKSKFRSEFDAIRHYVPTAAEPQIELERPGLRRGDYVQVRSPTDGEVYSAHIDRIRGDVVRVTYEGQWKGQYEDVRREDILGVIAGRAQSTHRHQVA
jgi:hypothetical protein